MKKYILLLFLLMIMLVSTALNQQVFSQTDTLTLDFCQQKALENYPLLKQKNLLNNASEINLSDNAKAYLPQIALNGQATYQSETTELPIKIPNVEIPSLYKDAYKATLDVTQVIYDGGLVSAKNKLEKASIQADLQSVESELYKLKDKVNTIYFSIITLQENKKLLKISKKDVQNKLAKIESGVKNGVVLESNALVLKAEIIKIDQQISEIDYSISSGYKMLGDYLNITIPDSAKLKLPEASVISTNYDNKRPEVKVFELQEQKLDISKSLLDCKLMPKVAAFGQLGYGRPGLNMLSNTFDAFYMLGAKVSWTLWDWNETKNDKKIIDIQKQVLETQKETFNQGIKILLEKYIADIAKYENMIESDNDIISIREKVVKTAESQLENGTITSTEYLTEMNNLLQSKINLQSHKILLAKTKVDYLTLKGNF
ncbi:MAG TPA: TolC family protein [Bacteroidales bacterium]|nr:TolC family protein [Bacteroidales bacterium]HPS15908.1 TolC family protein [Bacteroidales bacterium]